jgi:hypothetical protein
MIRVVAQYETAVLVNTGRPVPGRDETVEVLREGRVYDAAAGRLEPQHGGRLPVGSLYWNGEWNDVTIGAEEATAIEARIAALLAAEREVS